MGRKHFSFLKICALFLIVSIGISAYFIVFHKSDEEKIIDLADNLSIALNEGDFEKMLECFEPKYRNQLNAIMNSASSLIGFIDLKDIWTLGSTGLSDEEVQITINNISINNNQASAEISLNGGIYGSETTPVDLVKTNGKWYFKGDSLF